MVGTAMSPEMEALKTRLKGTWESGDYTTFAKYMESGSVAFFEQLGIAPGTTLLDVGCGAGQLTIPAARKGIRVTGVDLAQNLVDEANRRAREENLDIEIMQGDAEALQFPDESFDVVLSFIGAMFAPRPELVASELTRVCRRGGRIIMGNWTPEGHVGQMFKVIGQYAPPPPYFPSPLLWGNEEKVRERLGPGTSELTITRRMFPFSYPFSPAQVAEFFVTYYGPTVKAYASLEEGKKEDFLRDFAQVWERNNLATDGTTRVDGEFLEVVGIKA
jgi:ubiquinone/menaquinone biosynthesis C-methylase UbiE